MIIIDCFWLQCHDPENRIYQRACKENRVNFQTFSGIMGKNIYNFVFLNYDF